MRSNASQPQFLQEDTDTSNIIVQRNQFAIMTTNPELVEKNHYLNNSEKLETEL